MLCFFCWWSFRSRRKNYLGSGEFWCISGLTCFAIQRPRRPWIARSTAYSSKPPLSPGLPPTTLPNTQHHERRNGSFSTRLFGHICADESARTRGSENMSCVEGRFRDAVSCNLHGGSWMVAEEGIAMVVVGDVCCGRLCVDVVRMRLYPHPPGTYIRRGGILPCDSNHYKPSSWALRLHKDDAKILEPAWHP